MASGRFVGGCEEIEVVEVVGSGMVKKRGRRRIGRSGEGIDIDL